ncbi:MAG: hypothetical protein WD048_07995 [Chitinophagales bacterium]
MELKDLFLTPIYLLIFYAIASRIKGKHFSDHPFAPYFMPALYVKFVGAIGAGMVYWFYYGYGDTRGFYKRGVYLAEALMDNPSHFFHLMFPSNDGNASMEVMNILHSLRALEDPASYFMFKISAILSFFTFSTYTCIALFFAFFSFLSSLYFYKVLYRRFPELYKEIAIAIFFIPSVFFWGSGLFKDSLTMSALFLVAGASFNIVERYKTQKSFFILLFGAYLILNIKAYILLSFAPCFGLYLFLSYNYKIKSVLLRGMLLPFFLIVGIGTGYFLLQQVSSYAGGWSLENIEDKAYDMQQWHNQVKIYEMEGKGSGGGSSYSVGAIGDFSITGMLKSFPKVIVITFFRPFLWEVSSPTMLFTSLEGLFFLLLTLKIVWKNGFRIFFSGIFNNPIVLFFLSFALIFGFAVGYTSFNFGALSRYKIPALPFYLLFLYFSSYFMREKTNQQEKPIPQKQNLNNLHTQHALN